MLKVRYLLMNLYCLGNLVTQVTLSYYHISTESLIRWITLVPHFREIKEQPDMKKELQKTIDLTYITFLGGGRTARKNQNKARTF